VGEREGYSSCTTGTGTVVVAMTPVATGVSWAYAVWCPAIRVADINRATLQSAGCVTEVVAVFFANNAELSAGPGDVVALAV